MNRVGVHALVWAGGWSEQESRRAIESSRAAGYDLIEIPVLDPSAIDVAMTRKVLDDVGLGAACSLGLNPDTDISSPDAEVVARGERLLHDALVVTRDLGAEYLGGVLSSALAKYTRPPSAEGRANAVRVLRGLAERAAASGIALGLEVVNRYESNLLNTVQQALQFIAEVGAGNLKVHLDTYHMNIEESDFVTPVLACGDRLGYVHVGESHRGYLGTGTVDFPAFFRALAAIHYQGTVTFESFSSAVVAPGLSTTLAIWRDTWTDGADLARHARQFIDVGLHAAHTAQAGASEVRSHGSGDAGH
ncbi:MAG: sugar phosphate isomerase/epimerase family protein [Ktedonobacterales bacterium]